MLSATCLMTDEAKVEIKKKLQSREYYISPSNEMFFNSSTDVIDLVLANMTE